MQVNKTYESLQGYLVDVPDTLAYLQRLVQGHLEVVHIYENIVLVCNENGKNNDKFMNRLLFDPEEMEMIDIICGDCFCCRVDIDDFTSIKEEDVKIITNLLRPIKIIDASLAMIPEDLALKRSDVMPISENIKKGTYLRLESDLYDPCYPIKEGAFLKVSYIDDASQIHGEWLAPYKSSLALIHEIDKFSIMYEGYQGVIVDKASESYNIINIDGEISNEVWFELLKDDLDKYFKREINDVQLMEIAWNKYFDYKSKN